MRRALFLTFILFFPALLPAQGGGASYLFQPRGANFFVYGRGPSQFILRHGKITNTALRKNIMSLASAKRINKAADDPAGLAVAEKMDSLIKGLKQEAMNDQDWRNYMRYTESVIARDQRLLKRIHQLILRSASGILGPDDRAMNQREIDQLLRQINMNARFSQFNKKQVIPKLTVKALGLDGVDVVRNLYGSAKLVKGAMKKLRRLRTKAGVADNVLTFRIKGKTLYMVNMIEGYSRIADQDMAEGISQLMKNRVLLKTQYGILVKGK